MHRRCIIRVLDLILMHTFSFFDVWKYKTICRVSNYTKICCAFTATTLIPSGHQIKRRFCVAKNVNNTALQLIRSTPSKVPRKVPVGYPLTAMGRQRPWPRTKADTLNSSNIQACLALFSERHPLAELFAILLGSERQEDGHGVTEWNFSWWPHWGKGWRVLALPACLPASRRRRRGGRAEDTTAGASWVRQHSPAVYLMLE